MAEEAKKTEMAAREEVILAYWNENKIFEKTLKKDAPKGDYIFYDGPPFATGLPHYGHIVASVIKDVVPRFWTMQGYRVPRKWGWDCHGLPIENIVEKEMGSKHKKDIEAVGVAKFNELCRAQVMTYADEWKKIIPRIGRWADMENPYFTMSKEFMESVWWVFKSIYDKGLVYEDYRIMHVCPRCETTLSQQEVSEGYKDVKDIAVTVKFKVLNPAKYHMPENTFLLTWTTTPWTLPGNTALAVGKDIVYGVFESEGNTYIARADMEGVGTKKHTLVGNDLVGMEYVPPFDYYINDTSIKHHENGWKVYAADFVTADAGTGIAHEAPAFGADDWELSKKYHLPFVQHVKGDGTMKPEVTAFAGMEVKPKSDEDKVRLGTDIAVLKYLQEHEFLFAKENITHSYPHCWRCDSPLLNYATSSWFVAVEKIKPTLLETAQSIHWSPEHIKEGRWGQWLLGARDWSISRQRFWASVIPLWRCDTCASVRVFGSAKELEEASGKKIDDLHKHIVDEITVPCTCGQTMHRIPDVLDTWFDSGSMPYGQAHYPFENKDTFEKVFPAQFIAEGIDQTRAWFYYMHVLAGGIFEKNAFQNVIVNGIVLAEDGKKMSKKLKNYPDPMLVVDTYGADALRMYLLSSPVMQAENLAFSEKGVNEWKGVLTRLENVVSFYELYKHDAEHKPSRASTHILDQWILARLTQLHTDVTEAMRRYDLTGATRPFAGFVDDFSTWYLRRSRERIKGGNISAAQALETTLYVLRETARLLAPFAPFMAESVWQKVKLLVDDESVHLCPWTDITALSEDETAILTHMSVVREQVTLALSARTVAGIAVRQPLQTLTVIMENDTPRKDEYFALIAEEVNIKEVKTGTENALDTTITPELKREGDVRELLRAVQDLRKKKNLNPSDTATLVYRGDEAFVSLLQSAQEQLTKVANITKLHTTETELDSATEVVIVGKGTIVLT